MSTFIVKHAKANNLKIVEAKEPLTIQVHSGDIRRAQRKNAKCCAFACAAKRDPEIRNAFFFRSIAYLEQGDRLIRYTLPSSVQKEIVTFDRAKIMEPGTYHIHAPHKSETLRAHQKRTDAKRARSGTDQPNRKVRLVHSTQNIRRFGNPENA